MSLRHGKRRKTGKAPRRNGVKTRMSRKIALVTGSGRGIGKGIAIELAKAGYDLGIHYSSSAEGAQDTAQKCRALGARTRFS